ncbi:helix-hairpin-helix domain-containing protein [Streptomyces sp. NPDC057253]|uniref:helix-hairpin-helix domain-containing protein n=1 Tax=Streptomyces sp. NPDC057253 TaxID=3346069 RepID=UPI003625F080
MALRSRSRTATATSGPGRGPHSDGRSRHRRPPATRGGGGGRARHRHASSADELQRRAEVLFAERVGARRDSGKGPPTDARGLAEEGAGGGAVDLVGGGAAVEGAGSGDGDVRSPDAWDTSTREAGARETSRRDSGLLDEDWRGVDSGDEAWRAVDTRREVRHGVDARREARAGVEAGDGAWRERAGMALRERLPVWLQARCGLERRNVVALSVLLVVAAVFAVQHFWTGRTQSVQAPEVVRAAAPFEESGTGGQDGGPRGETQPAVSGEGSNTPGTAGAEIVVDVSGKVREPGVHRLPAGSRVADALKAAGGVRPGTDTDALNRARFLVDGEQVVVGGPAPAPAPGVAGGPVNGGPAGPVGGGGPAGAAAPVSLNTATVDQLDTLPGVGPVLAQHILDYRTRHGGFRSVDELREVNGIGDRRFADLRNLVRP